MAATGELKPPFSLEQLVSVARSRLDDLPGDIAAPTQSWDNDDSGLLWTNDELCTFADEAQQEVARRKPILDSSTPEITEIAMPITVQTVSYDARILMIDRVKVVETASADEVLLTKRSQFWMDRRYRDWELEGNATTPGTPMFWIDYMDERKIKLYPVPDLVGVLHLTVWRMALAHLSWTLRHKILEVASEHHMDMIDWIQYRAYLKRDAETENLDLAAVHKAIFDERIGPRPSAKIERVRRMEHRLGRRVQAHYF